MFLVPFLFSDPYLQLFPLCNGHHKLANRCARITDEDIYSYCSSCSLHYFHSKAALFNAGTFKVHAAKGSDQELINPTYCPMPRVVLVAGRWWWTASTSTLSCATGPVQQTHIVHWKLQTGDIFFIPNMSHIPSFDMIWSQRSQFPLPNSSYRSPSVLSARCLHQARSGLSLPRAQVITIIIHNHQHQHNHHQEISFPSIHFQFWQLWGSWKEEQNMWCHFVLSFLTTFCFTWGHFFVTDIQLLLYINPHHQE